MKIVVLCAGLLSSLAFAELDPELAAASPKNSSGLIIGGGLRFGQSYVAGGSTSKLGTLATVEIGYSARNDSWGRYELGLEIAGGQVAGRLDDDGKSNLALALLPATLIKAGYGWSLGSSVFMVAKVGAGIAMADATFKNSTGKFKSTDTMSGSALYGGVDVVVPMTSALDLVAGVSVTHYKFDVDELEHTSSKIKFDLNEEYLVNLIAAQAGVRVTF